jgi:hypothetical protein
MQWMGCLCPADGQQDDVDAIVLFHRVMQQNVFVA